MRQTSFRDFQGIAISTVQPLSMSRRIVERALHVHGGLDPGDIPGH